MDMNGHLLKQWETHQFHMCFTGNPPQPCGFVYYESFGVLAICHFGDFNPCHEGWQIHQSIGVMIKGPKAEHTLKPNILL